MMAERKDPNRQVEDLSRELTQLHDENRQLLEHVRQLSERLDASFIDRLHAERDLAQTQVREIAAVRDEIHGWWQRAEAELRAIHSSKMWRFWMFYLLVRRVSGWPFRSLGKGLSSSCSRFQHPLGGLYSLLMSCGNKMKAWTRRRTSWQQRSLAPRPSGQLACGRKLRLLLVMPYSIFPPNHGGAVRLYNLVRLLGKRLELHLVVFSYVGEDQAQREALAPHCCSLSFHTWVPAHRPDRFGLKPINAQLFWSEELAQEIPRMVDRHGIDIVQLEYTELGQYARCVPAGVPVILTEHDIAFRTHRRRLRLSFADRYPESRAYCRNTGDVRRIFNHELQVCAAANQIHVMSQADGEYLAPYLRDGWERIRVVPNGVDCAEFAPTDDGAVRRGVLYVGNFQNYPNVDALEFLVHDVWPLLKLRCPDAELAVVGAHAQGTVSYFDGKDSVTVIGEVDEIAPFYQQCRVLAAPIRAGSGTRLKILEAFAAGIPVVSTTLGAEGIECRDGEHLLIADSAVDFARCIELLIRDDELSARISRSAATLARQIYDWPRVADSLLGSYAELMIGNTNESRDLPQDPGHDGEIAGPVDAATHYASAFSADEVRPRVSYDLLSEHQPARSRASVLVVGIYLVGSPNNARDIVGVLRATERFDITQRWIALGGPPGDGFLGELTVRDYPEMKAKIEILNDVITEADLCDFDYVVVCDDDVVLPERFLDHFLDLQQRLDFRIAQPARTVDSFIDIPITEQHPRLVARRTLFVEQGPVISFHSSTFDFVFPLIVTSPMGWGLENVWSMELSKRGLAMGIIDNVPVDHSMRKPLAHYSWEEADRGRTALLESHDHRANGECFRVLEIVSSETISP